MFSSLKKKAFFLEILYFFFIDLVSFNSVQGQRKKKLFIKKTNTHVSMNFFHRHYTPRPSSLQKNQVPLLIT